MEAYWLGTAEESNSGDRHSGSCSSSRRKGSGRRRRSRVRKGRTLLHCVRQRQQGERGRVKTAILLLDLCLGGGKVLWEAWLNKWTVPAWFISPSPLLTTRSSACGVRGILGAKNSSHGCLASWSSQAEESKKSFTASGVPSPEAATSFCPMAGPPGLVMPH